VPQPIYLNLSAFYFFYFAYLGAFAPFFALYLTSVGMSAVEIGMLMALPQLTRILAPHLWGWLADRSGRRMHIVRASGAVGTVVFMGVFAGESFALLCTVLFAMTFFWSAALPLVEATTLAHLGDETARYGRIRVWGSVGFIAAVVAVGYLLDAASPRALLWVIAALMAGMLLLSCTVAEAPAVPHGVVFSTEVSLSHPLELRTTPPAEAWSFPIATVAKSERGLDQTVQGESVTLRWPAAAGGVMIAVG